MENCTTDYGARFLQNLSAHLRKIDRRRPWLSKQTGISLNTINTWFTTGRAPRLDHAYCIADTLGVTLEYLVTGESFYERYDAVTEDIINMVQSVPQSRRRELHAAAKMFLLASREGSNIGDHV